MVVRVQVPYLIPILTDDPFTIFHFMQPCVQELVKKPKAIPTVNSYEGSVRGEAHPLPSAQVLTVEQEDKMDAQDQSVLLIMNEDEQDSVPIKCEPPKVKEGIEGQGLVIESNAMPTADCLIVSEEEGKQLPPPSTQLMREDKAGVQELNMLKPVMAGGKQDGALACTQPREPPVKKAKEEVKEEAKSPGLATCTGEVKAKDGPSRIKEEVKMETDVAGPSHANSVEEEEEEAITGSGAPSSNSSSVDSVRYS